MDAELVEEKEDDEDLPPLTDAQQRIEVQLLEDLDLTSVLNPPIDDDPLIDRKSDPPHVIQSEKAETHRLSLAMSRFTNNKLPPVLEMDDDEYDNAFKFVVEELRNSAISLQLKDETDNEDKRGSTNKDDDGRPWEIPNKSRKSSSEEKNTTRRWSQYSPRFSLSEEPNTSRRSSQKAEANKQDRTYISQEPTTSKRLSQEEEAANQRQISTPEPRTRMSEGKAVTNQLQNPDVEGLVNQEESRASHDLYIRADEKVFTGDLSKDCGPQTITIGEPEKEQLQAAGQHLLEIGHQLLKEMNFIEGLLGKFGSLVFNGSNKQRNGSLISNSSAQERKQFMDEEGMQPLMQAITEKGNRLSWQGEEEQQTKRNSEERKISYAKTKFGSGFESPQLNLSQTIIQSASTCRELADARTNCQSQSMQNINIDFRKRLAGLEVKMEKMNSKMEGCEKHVKDVYTTLCGALNRLSEEILALREIIDKEDRQGTMIRSVMDEKISCFEQQIQKLTTVIWELKCETRVQMHFGGLDCR